MIAYRYDNNFMYVGVQMCQRDPIASAKAGKEIYLLPAQCTHAVPPEPKDGYNIVWSGEAWEYQEIPAEPEPETPEPHVPTTEDKMNQLDSQYERDKKTLQSYYLDFMIAGDTEGMESIKGELTALATQYDSDIEALKGGEE